VKVIIVGGGKVGTYLASLLLSNGHHVRVIESRDEQLPTLIHDLPVGTIIEGSGTNLRTLEAAGIQQADVVVAVTGTDETNLVAAILAKFDFSVRRVIARINNPKNAWLFTSEMGVDVALNQADLIAHLAEEEMSLGEMMTLLKLKTGNYSLVEEKVDPRSIAVSKTLQELNLSADCIIVSIIREKTLILPRGNTILLAGDEVLAITNESAICTLADILGPAR
jgi:trk system potassium uptake protein